MILGRWMDRLRRTFFARSYEIASARRFRHAIERAERVVPEEDRLALQRIRDEFDRVERAMMTRGRRP